MKLFILKLIGKKNIDESYKTALRSNTIKTYYCVENKKTFALLWRTTALWILVSSEN